MNNRIAFVVGTLNTGGIEKMVSALSISLRAKGWFVLVVCIGHKKGKFLNRLLTNDIKVEECSVKKILFTFRFAQLLRQFRIEVVHSHVAFSMPWQVLGCKMAGVPRIVFTQQNEYQNWANHWIRRLRYRMYFAIFFRFISVYTCVSFSVRKSLSILVGVREAKFVVIPNAVDLTSFFRDEGIRDRQRALLNIKEGTQLVGTVARFAPQKGHEVLFQAFQMVVRGIPDATLILIGSGELEQSLRAQCTSLGIESSVIFYGNTLEINSLLNAIDVFVLSSWWEGFGICLIEAMAVGLPIITTKVAGVCNFVPSSSMFRVVEAGDVDAIHDQLISVLKTQITNEDRIQQIKSVAERFQLEDVVKHYTSLYRSR